MNDREFPYKPYKTRFRMRDVVETALGRSAGEAALDAFNDAIESGSSELLEFRADLSYLPPSP